MSWYDIASLVYDASVELVYRPYRAEIADALRLEPESTVLDLACGTGGNQPFLHKALGPQGRVFGVDYSAGMLARARKKAKRVGWNNVFLLQQDARALTVEQLKAACGASVKLDRVLVTLGLSVIPDWEEVFDATFKLLAPGGRYVVFDIHQERWVPQSWIIERIARADLNRRVWQPLQRQSEDFELRFLKGSPHLHGGRPFIATGTKLSPQNDEITAARRSLE